MGNGSYDQKITSLFESVESDWKGWPSDSVGNNPGVGLNDLDIAEALLNDLKFI